MLACQQQREGGELDMCRAERVRVRVRVLVLGEMRGLAMDRRWILVELLRLDRASALAEGLDRPEALLRRQPHTRAVTAATVSGVIDRPLVCTETVCLLACLLACLSACLCVLVRVLRSAAQ